MRVHLSWNNHRRKHFWLIYVKYFPLGWINILFQIKKKSRAKPPVKRKHRTDKWKDRQYNSQRKRDKKEKQSKANNEAQTLQRKLKIKQHKPHNTIDDELICPGGVSNSCSTNWRMSETFEIHKFCFTVDHMRFLYNCIDQGSYKDQIILQMPKSLCIKWFNINQSWFMFSAEKVFYYVQNGDCLLWYDNFREGSPFCNTPGYTSGYVCEKIIV